MPTSCSPRPWSSRRRGRSAGRRLGRSGSVAGGRQPAAGPPALPVLREGPPAVDLIGPAVEDVLEAPERPPALDGDLQELGPAGVVDRSDEPLHVAIATSGTLALHVEP